ncbi:zinc-binding dehydrogenase [Formicincola oecophyllae]|uniref:enoyl-[acyl-carrier-protein] reductase n=2 Tax=Formicincola oecophyllae TaxID=2558361 RepID=A0A4Y6UAA1_9PROT|nr:zinc-binding dehydrogenase [Formicincola oecophyllae]
MNAVVLDKFGEPEDVLHPGTMPTPTIGPDQVLVKTIMAPIHNHHLWIARGLYGIRPPLPAVDGDEAVGTIAAVGANVKGLAVGQRVACARALGTWAQYFAAPADLVVPVPEGIDDETASQMLIMPMSALMLLDSLHLKAGDWLIHNAANGAVGKALAIMAKGRGIHTINLVRSPKALDEMVAAGITAGNISTAQTDWTQQAAKLMGGNHAAAAVDGIGGPLDVEMTSLLREGGELVSFGSQGGQAVVVSPADLIFRAITVRGFWANKEARSLPAADKARLVGEIVGLLQSGQLKMPVAGVYSFSHITQALEANAKAGRNGKVLLKP